MWYAVRARSGRFLVLADDKEAVIQSAYAPRWSNRLGHWSFNPEITGSNPVRGTVQEDAGWNPALSERAGPL